MITTNEDAVYQDERFARVIEYIRSNHPELRDYTVDSFAYTQV